MTLLNTVYYLVWEHLLILHQSETCNKRTGAFRYQSGKEVAKRGQKGPGIKQPVDSFSFRLCSYLHHSHKTKVRMEKKGDPTSIPMSYDDGQSTYSMDQPPPAYKKPEAPSVKIAKIIAATLFGLSVVIGGVVIASVYIQTKNQCILIPQTVPFDTLNGAESAPIAEALQQGPAEQAVESQEDNSAGSDEKIHIPLQLDIDDLAGQMMENNQRARMNCLIEKKKAEEVVTQTPKQLRTPFGNLTTDHRYVHITGESMSLSCRSGNARSIRPIPMDDVRQQQQQQQQHMQSRMHMQPHMQPQMQQPLQMRMNMQPQPQHAMMGGPPHLLMGPGGPMGPPPPSAQALIMELHGFREPRSDHPRAKRQLKQCDCACEC
uniref:Uncharacterized protein n=1 Tax=Strigamia maritima TaxID=126957 RepID=T1J248_STRMM